MLHGLLLTYVLAAASASKGKSIFGRSYSPTTYSKFKNSSHPGTANCSELFYEQTIDHFTSTPPPLRYTTYNQRYFLNVDYYDSTKPATIFFYFGNEADVSLYVNNTGLMWESAADFNAILLFAEHRYYGVSQPFGADFDITNKDLMQYLSVEQALADYAELLHFVRSDLKVGEDVAVIGFGGSYGGMLASWGRFKYPQHFDGVIAASAPIISFVGQKVDPNFFAEGMTYDVKESGGVDDNGACEANLRKAFEQEWLVELAKSEAGRKQLSSGLGLCDEVGDASAGFDAMYWLNSALSYMAMGDYPYSSDYILNGDGFLPAFPVVEACKFLGEDMTKGGEEEDDLLAGLSLFAGVYYNNSGSVECYNLTSAVNPAAETQETLWNFQYCTEIFQIFGQEGGETDIFWNAPWDAEEAAENCATMYWGEEPRQEFIYESYGDIEEWARATSNIVWSNGELDPWRGGGVGQNLSESLLSVVVPKAAHHVDLFFANEGDTAEILAVREFEKGQMRVWAESRRN